jgi:hypothetical protein
MKKELDEIIYDALTSDSGVTALVPTARIFSTCVEVPPMDQDNTPLPYIIITDDPMTSELGTKDDQWESDEDSVQASVLINAESPNAVRLLRRKVRHAIAQYVEQMTKGQPCLRAFSNDGIAWDWTKPCYHDTLHYQCDIEVDLNDEDDGSKEEI